MSFYDSPLRKRASRALGGALALIVVMLVVQIWLLMASVESWLAGHHDVALPATIISGCLFASCAGLLALIREEERSAQTRR